MTQNYLNCIAVPINSNKEPYKPTSPRLGLIATPAPFPPSKTHFFNTWVMIPRNTCCRYLSSRTYRHYRNDPSLYREAVVQISDDFLVKDK